jgi:3-hydroxyacyl-CoA dehydrogenase
MAKKFGKSIGKETVVAKDLPGFIVNRLLTPFLCNAAKMVEAGIATPEDIDKAVTLGLNHPMGPLTMLDFSGIELFLQASTAKYEELKDLRKWWLPVGMDERAEKVFTSINSWKFSPERTKIIWRNSAIIIRLGRGLNGY